MTVFSLRSQRERILLGRKALSHHAPDDTGLWVYRHSPQAWGAHPSPSVLFGALRLHCKREELAVEVGVP